MSHVAAEKGLARNSVEAYGNDLRAFIDLMERRGVCAVERVARDDIVAYLSGLSIERADVIPLTIAYPGAEFQADGLIVRARRP